VIPGVAAVLALADQRLPSGGHVHSGGVEQAVTDGVVRDVATLEAFLARRLRTAGLVSAGIAAAAAGACAGPETAADLARLDVAADARTPSPAQRAASRAQGRGLLRLATTAWPAPSPQVAWAALGARPHHAVVVGCAAHAAGADPAGAALVAAYLAVSGPATAAQRLLALDPLAVAAATLRLGAGVEQVAADASGCLAAGRDQARWCDPDGLPDDSDPLLDLLAERHASREERLFAS
jgi:urease accessory protein